MDLTGWKKCLISVWSIVETVLFAGIWLGWASLVFVLKAEGIYADLCQTNETDEVHNSTDQLVESGTVACNAQDDMFGLAFTICTASVLMTATVVGHMTYNRGIRFTRMLGISMFLTGSLMLAFLSVDTPWLLFPGITLIATGGFPLLITNSQISVLYNKRGSTFLCGVTGAFGISSVVMTIVKIAFENGISRKVSFLAIAGLHSLVIISTVFFLPNFFIKKLAKNSDLTVSAANVTEAVTTTTEYGKDHSGGMARPTQEDSFSSLKVCILSKTHLLHMFWFSVLQLRFFHFIGSLNPSLNRILSGDEAGVSYYTNVCYFTFLAGIVAALLFGLLYDRQRQIFTGSKSRAKRDLMPAVLPLSISSLLGVLVSLLVLIPKPEVLYLTFIVVTLLRSSMYGTNFVFLISVFPRKYFSMLQGLSYTVSGLVGFSQYGFFKWADSYGEAPKHADIVLLCVVSLSLVHPFYQWSVSRRAEGRAHKDDVKGKNLFVVIDSDGRDII